jgi:hypothetical protein
MGCFVAIIQLAEKGLILRIVTIGSNIGGVSRVQPVAQPAQRSNLWRNIVRALFMLSIMTHLHPSPSHCLVEPGRVACELVDQGIQSIPSVFGGIQSWAKNSISEGFF